MMFVAHIDHPGLSNDDMAGCAVGIELLNRIAEKYPSSSYTYKLLLVPEIVGSVFYLKALGEGVKNIKYAMFLEALGNNNSFNFQGSYSGDSYIDRVSRAVLARYPDSRLHAFRESVGNDEIVFEAPGIEIPTPSISRFPYPEYHTSDENMDIILEDKLEEAVQYLMDIVFILENDRCVKRRFDGLVSLANPKYDLYIDPGQIITGDLHKNKKMELFQSKMPRLLDGYHSIFDVAEMFGVDFSWLCDYFKEMEEKNLITMFKIN